MKKKEFKFSPLQFFIGFLIGWAFTIIFIALTSCTKEEPDAIVDTTEQRINKPKPEPGPPPPPPTPGNNDRPIGTKKPIK